MKVNKDVALEEKSDKQKAIEWWNGLFYNQQQEYNHRVNGDFLNWLSADQIEDLWRKEVGLTTKQIESMNIVDFNMLLRIKDKDSCYRQVNMEEDELDNLKLFFDLLSKSSTFAHKAHKELNKLNK